MAINEEEEQDGVGSPSKDFGDGKEHSFILLF